MVMSDGYLSELFDLQDKVPVVTGGGGVLCGAIGRALGQVGANSTESDLLPVCL